MARSGRKRRTGCPPSSSRHCRSSTRSAWARKAGGGSALSTIRATICRSGSRDGWSPAWNGSGSIARCAMSAPTGCPETARSIFSMARRPTICGFTISSAFFIDVGRDPGFNADTLVAAIDSERSAAISTSLERFLYRNVVFPRVQQALLSTRRAARLHRTTGGLGSRAGRHLQPLQSDPVQFPDGRRTRSATSRSTGPPIFRRIWKQRPREGMNLHWDGNNSSVAERNLSAALGAGVTPVTVDRRRDPADRGLDVELAPSPVPRRRRRSTRSRPSAGDSCSPTIAPAVMASSGIPPMTIVPPLSRSRRGRAALCNRHGSGTLGVLHAGLRGRPEHPVCRLSLAVLAISARRTDMRASRSTASGRARPTCTTARCRHCATCSSRPRAGLRSGIRGGDVLDLARVGYRPDPSAPRRRSATTPLCPATATEATRARPTARHCRRPTRTPSSNT